MNIFMEASRLNLRFNFKGLINVTDLWALPLNQLNTIAKGLNRELKQDAEEDFLSSSTTQVTNYQAKLRFDIVVEIIQVRQEEANKKLHAAERNIQRRKIKELLQQKTDTRLNEKSMEELQKMLDEL